MGVKEIIGTVASWSMMVISVMIILGSFMHLNAVLGGQNWCEDQQALYGSDVKCVGDSLVWKNGNKGVRDYNGKWRETFTFQPSYFVDTWTPFFYGALALIQGFSTMRADVIVGNWGRCLAFYLFGAFWAVFGYAGNWGVFWGFVITLYLCPMLLLLSVLDKESELDTQVDMIKYLAMVGLTTKQSETGSTADHRGPPVNLPPQENPYPVAHKEPEQFSEMPQDGEMADP